MERVAKQDALQGMFSELSVDDCFKGHYVTTLSSPKGVSSLTDAAH